MRYAETGYDLEIDLSRGSIEKVASEPDLAEYYLGGQGVAAKILFERVPPDTDPFSPDNLLIFSTGLLHATPAPAANRTVVNTFSPQTNLMSHSLFGGFFGPELKHAGYDRIIIRGKAPDLVYLYINNDTVEIRDATHLRGKGSTETGDLLKKELNDYKVQVAAIGLAGENRVFTASIEHNHASAARGVGVIMGDKRLKAIAVRGTKDVNIAKPAEMFELCQDIHLKMAGSDGCGDWMAVDEDDSFHHNHFAWGNSRKRIKDYWSPELQRRWTDWKYDHMDRQTGCYNCPKKCRNVINWPGRPRFAYKCFGKDTYHMAAFLELDFTFEILGVAQEYGLDSYSTPQVMAFALELLEAGILSDSDFPGMPADRMNSSILRKISPRRIRHPGRRRMPPGSAGAEYDHNTTKKFEQLPIKLGRLNPAYFLMIATGEKMSITQIEGSFPQDPLPTKEQREEFVSKWEAVPDEKFKKYFLEWEKRSDMSDERTCDIVDWNEAMHYIDDSIGTCGFVSSFRGQFGGDVPYHMNNIPQIISMATGIDMDKEKLWKAFQRIRTLVRAVNVRRGLRRKDERPPEDHWAVRDEKYEQELLTKYYEFKGWNYEGIPTRETLERLDLGYVADDLEERGILTPADSAPAKTAVAV
jgi:aldehyde:ferredoxin oxidoreductase